MTAGIVALFDVLARRISLALQYGAPLEQVGERLLGVKVEPAGLVAGHDRVRLCTGAADLIGRLILREGCSRSDLAYTQPRAEESDPQRATRQGRDRHGGQNPSVGFLTRR